MENVYNPFCIHCNPCFPPFASPFPWCNQLCVFQVKFYDVEFLFVLPFPSPQVSRHKSAGFGELQRASVITTLFAVFGFVAYMLCFAL